MSYLFRKKSVEKVLHDAAVAASDTESKNPHLKRALSVRDLTALGIAAIVGAGIFSTIGKASFDGGPGIVLLFIFVAIACGFSALCYAEFASMVPVSGSAYTYAYVAFGELVAWIIGWDLLMEYAIGNIAVSISWSDYFTTFLAGFGIAIPAYFTMDYWTAQAMLTPDAVAAWTNAPILFGIKIICDLPAFFIVVVITYITYIGIQESRNSANAMVALKLAVIFLVIAVGTFYVKPENWSPFLPNGISGVLNGTAAVFFAYIGFDAISTTAEEAENPQRDLPKSMVYSLIICTIIYIAIGLVLTGMVSYSKLNVGDPLAFVFNELNLGWLAGIIALSAVVATASVMLVFQIGQPRIWLSMSRDGLLPKVFSKIHPKYQTPSFSTILTGFVVAIPALFLNMNVVIDLTSVGTLFAFVLVCGGILKLQLTPNRPKSSFSVPYINAKYILPIMFIASVFAWWHFNSESFFSSDFSSWQSIRTIVPYIVFAVLALSLSVLSFLKNLSLIPALGMLSCSYLLCESGTTNWERFLIWLLLGLVVYFLYGKKKSKLAATPIQ
ncbi:MAG TPA: amino acid permease [Chitinophagales bacterium]|nr:amino acid permease [Chitinophagales bacterium]HRP39648.1 amino acid permease [Chitinophagales bacterium]